MFQTIIGRNINYNVAKRIIQSESYLEESDGSIIRRKGILIEDLEEENWIYFSEEENTINNRKGNAFDDLEENIVDIAANKNVNTNFTKKGDLAYEVMGLFTKQKVDRYCNSESRNEKIEQDATDVCQLYW